MQILRKSLSWFSQIMEKQMQRNDWMKPWESGEAPVLHFVARLQNETELLYESIIDYHLNPTESLAAECQLKAADVANLASIIASMHSPEMGKLNRGR